jgi:hypothetical protein
VPVDDVEAAATDEGLPPEQAQAIADDYGEAQLDGLKKAIGAIGVFALLAFWFTRRLPGRSLDRESSSAVEPERPTSAPGYA